MLVVDNPEAKIPSIMALLHAKTRLKQHSQSPVRKNGEDINHIQVKLPTSSGYLISIHNENAAVDQQEAIQDLSSL